MNKHDERPESDGLREYYDFDYRETKPNRFAARLGEGQLMVVVDADLAAIFPTSEAVNDALRVLANAAQSLSGVSAEVSAKRSSARLDVLAKLPAGSVVLVEEPVTGD